MALLDPLEDGALRLGMPLTLRFAGAESNFAIALARLGIEVAWISRLGRDPFGDLILAAVTGEGVETRWVRHDDAPTGLFCKWRSEGKSHVTYRRAGSAASPPASRRRAGRGARRRAGRPPDRDHDGDLRERPRARARRRAAGEGARRDGRLRPQLPPRAPGHARRRGRSAAGGPGARRLVPLRRGRGRASLAATARFRSPP